MLKITGYVMLAAPIAVFAAIAATITLHGPGSSQNLCPVARRFLCDARLLLWLALLGLALPAVRHHLRRFVKAIREPVLLAS